jgi:non-ribosomal peptide synthetase component F
VRPAVQSYKGATATFTVDQAETAALKELSRREGTTLFMVLLAAFHVLLSRYSGQTDIVVGTDVANRNRAETEGLIGFFVNQLPLRIRQDGNPTFQQLLKHVREVCLQAYAHQDLPFERLVEELQPERDLSRSPLFQIKLVLQNAPVGALQMENLKFSGAGGEGHTAKYDLLLNLRENNGILRGSLEYSTELFDRASIERLLDGFMSILKDIIIQPEARVNALQMLTEAEILQLAKAAAEQEQIDVEKLRVIKRRVSQLSLT